MKKILLTLLTLTLFTLNYSASAECDSVSNQSRIGRLPCPRVLANCITIQALEENHYLPEKPANQSQVDYEIGIELSHTADELIDICKSCVVQLSRDSKCINRGIKKCRKEYTLPVIPPESN